jgi:thiamine-phosphate pyrophosphorylase
MEIKGYYFITDNDLSKNGIISDCRNAILAGTRIIQYRNKNANSLELYEEAKILRDISRNSIFLINDRIDIALAVDADGVHLGQEDIPCKIARKILGNDKIIGITVHSLEEAKLALEDGANYLGIGAIFLTNTKKNAGNPVGLELIKNIKNYTQDKNIPLVAIGGINISNVKSVIDAGADAICAISDVVTKEDLKMEIEKYQGLFKND